jgi:ubiquinone/menaquinone biosynthesis C-methylase UbiE
VATIFRSWSHRNPWLHNSISWLAALHLGGTAKFRRLALEGLVIEPEMQVLDLCCGKGQMTQLWVTQSANVTGLDASADALAQAAQIAPAAKYVQGWAESMPFEDAQFDLVHVSMTLHEMRPVQLWRVLQEADRVLKPGGMFTFVDFHLPSSWIYRLGLDLFLALFETETVWQFIKTDLLDLLARVGFQQAERRLYAGGSLQVGQAHKRED